MAEVYKNPVKKMIPSKLETGFQQFLYKHVGPHIPDGVTPNQVTTVSALGGVFAIIMTLLTNFSRLFWIGTIIGLAVHLVADDLDGYVARTRGLSSKAGAYYDLMVDILFSTFLIIAMGLSPAAHLLPAALAAPLYGVMNVTMMNYIIYFNEFQFPRLGPIEAHLMYAGISILSMIFGGKQLFAVAGHGVTLVDMFMYIAMIPMYYEMVRMAVALFRRLKESQK
ncbi:CDP-alcohol phosphatidyltransferase family protein [Ruminococcus sp.]|uniref:CDP-alcohol phosphatidyltransferase family protein n=1 Tax=Ruminococcus sp. TaxID=41978 RepID=UPI0025E3C0A0|nr:CDP-alcohol phosphatidyltransferase family protein [Ruminococcus sp.]MBQ9543480.1 CDP-alcohol phosphatidyltransferase family protein [Ruminococcus sp.]